MKRALVALILCAAPSVFAARPTIGAQKFPDDYRPHPCAAPQACASLSKDEIVSVGATMRGYSLTDEWVKANWDAMLEMIRPTCAKLATCYATPGNQAIFCTDLLFPEFWGLCDARYPAGSKDNEQCAMFIRIYTLRADLQDKEASKAAQACAAEKTPRTAEGTLEVTMFPATIGRDYKGRFTVYALDRETRVPIQALVQMPDTRLSARAPGGRPWTNYEIEWPATWHRVPNADGHTDLVAPSISVTADGFAPVTLTMPMTPPKVIVEMSPAASQLKRGKNSVTFTAHDAETGKPVELRVMLGDTILGDTNKPLALELKKGGKRPEIWATSLFDRYSDVVIVPAEK
ncbi:MAG TPA: hypothetical protein VEU30_09430 [Thermoanaerobaculia bacterium]|nr:hypothetical protein [Thermoanaerobaculia bacterium]